MKKLIIALAASCIGLVSASSFAEEAMNKQEMDQQKKMSEAHANKHKKDKQNVKKHKEAASKEAQKQDVAK